MRVLFVYYVCAFIVCAVNASPHFGYQYDRNSAKQGGKEAESFFGGAAGGNSLALSQQHEHHQHQQQQSPQFLQQVPHQKPAQPFGGDKYLPPSAPVAETIVTKQFFLVSAPEEHEKTQPTKHFVIGRPQKNYRVVFIKAPAPENSNIKLTAEYAPQEEKTVIYVLSKKDNELNIGDISTPAPTQPTKPEVFFIKYKTSEEALAAQKEIQEQYDHLGGTSEFSDVGVVPIKSVVGSLDGQAANGGYDYRQVQNGINSPIKDFLQPARFFY